jgi:hypothetical protein
VQHRDQVLRQKPTLPCLLWITYCHETTCAYVSNLYVCNWYEACFAFLLTELMLPGCVSRPSVPRVLSHRLQRLLVFAFVCV